MRRLVTREDYFEAALAILAEGGAGSLKVATLCSSLNVTSGSFYGYFGKFDAFVHEFLAYWQQTQTDRILALVAVPESPQERLLRLNELGRGLPHQAEGAIRSWAHTSKPVAEMQELVDSRRVQAIFDLLQPLGVSVGEAHILSTMAMTLLVGLQQWRQPRIEADFDEVFRTFGALVLGRLGIDPAPDFA